MTRKFWKIKAMDSQNPVVEIRGTILNNRASDSERSTCLEEFRSALRSISADEIDVVIDSPGGDLQAGIEIYETLKANPAKIRVFVEGCAASAASVAMCAGDEISLYDQSIVMIHNSWLRIDEPVDLRREDVSYIAQHMDENNLAMARIYSAKTKKDVAEIAQAMEKETYLKGQEAIDFGLCDYLIPNGKLMNVLTKAEVMAMADKAKKEAQAVVTEEVKEPVKEEPKKEIKKEAKPDLSKADKAMAELEEMKAEMARIEKLDELMVQANIDPETIRKAKYEDKITAEALAYKLLIDKASKEPEEVKVPDYINDMMDSGTANVPATDKAQMEVNPWAEAKKLMKKGK